MSEDFKQVSIDSVVALRVAGYWGSSDSTEKESEPVRVVRAGDITQAGELTGWADRWLTPKQASRAVCEPGDVLVTASGNGLGKCYLVGVEGPLASSNFTRRLAAKPDSILGAYLYVAIQSPLGAAKLREHTATSAFPNLKPTFFEDPWLPLPPLPVQRRIVDLIAHLDCHLANLRAEREALSVTLTSACLLMTTPHEGDEHASIPEVAEILDRLRVPISEDERVHRPGNVPYYGANGQVGWIDESIFDEPLVLVAEDGGPVAEWRTRPQAYAIDGPAWVNNHAHVLRATRVSRDWLYYSLRHRDLTALAPVGTRSKLTQASLKSITVSLPHDSMNRGRLLREIETTLDSLSREVLTVESARVQLLAGLLRGHFVIPESYDTLLSEVV